MYKKYKNKLLATPMSVPICLLSLALQTNRVKADETIPETQNTLSRNEQNSQTASNVNAASINQDDRKGAESQTNKLVRTSSNSVRQRW